MSDGRIFLFFSHFQYWFPCQEYFWEYLKKIQQYFKDSLSLFPNLFQEVKWVEHYKSQCSCSVLRRFLSIGNIVFLSFDILGQNIWDIDKIIWNIGPKYLRYWAKIFLVGRGIFREEKDGQADVEVKWGQIATVGGLFIVSTAWTLTICLTLIGNWTLWPGKKVSLTKLQKKVQTRLKNFMSCFRLVPPQNINDNIMIIAR